MMCGTIMKRDSQELMTNTWSLSHTSVQTVQIRCRSGTRFRYIRVESELVHLYLGNNCSDIPALLLSTIADSTYPRYAREMAIPRFSDLPVDKSGPHHNAWTLYGKDDQLGTLNRLSDDVVKAAAQEIKTGTRISLNWPLDAQGDLPMFGRQAFHKHVYQKPPRIGSFLQRWLSLC